MNSLAPQLFEILLLLIGWLLCLMWSHQDRHFGRRFREVAKADDLFALARRLGDKDPMYAQVQTLGAIRRVQQEGDR